MKALLKNIPELTIRKHLIIHFVLWILWFVLILAMPAQDDWRYMIPFYILYISAPIQLIWVFGDVCYRFIQGEYRQGIYLLILLIVFFASCIAALLFGFFIMMMKN